MNLLELARFYQIALKTEGRNAANQYLRDMGVEEVIRQDLAWCFNDDGEALHSIPKDENGDGGFDYVFEQHGDYVM